jgi:hypothetical protein
MNTQPNLVNTIVMKKYVSSLLSRVLAAHAPVLHAKPSPLAAKRVILPYDATRGIGSHLKKNGKTS